jgi:hypothetical protein
MIASMIDQLDGRGGFSIFDLAYPQDGIFQDGRFSLPNDGHLFGFSFVTMGAGRVVEC